MIKKIGRPKGSKTKNVKLKPRRTWTGGKAVPIPPDGIIIDDMPWFDPVRGVRIDRSVGDHEVAAGGGVRSGCWWRRPKHAAEEYD